MKQLTITENLKGVMRERYYQENESNPQQMLRRVSNFVAEGERQYGWGDKAIKALAQGYYTTQNNRLWLASSPFLMNAGTKTPMLTACFVMGGLNDDLGSIFNTLDRSANVWKMGGGTGFNFSNLREEGAIINSTGGTSSGVMSWMEMYNAAADVVKQGGRRRSANMGVLRYDHPEILKFISYKNDHDKLKNFNISVLVDNVFMQKVLTGEDYYLVSPVNGQIVGSLNAKEVFYKIMESNWRSAEPALLFVDNINENNPILSYLGPIITTNPCGEVTLYDDEACDLASINLEEFVDWDGVIHWDKLEAISQLVTRFLDTAIDVTAFPDENIERAVKLLRRLGMGVMSLHGLLIKFGLKYSSPEGRKFARTVMKHITEAGWFMSEKLAKEKGVFPLWEHSSFTKLRRNCAITTIAPTGTIQQILNTSSSGCEPIYALAYKRNILINGETKETFWTNPLFKEYAQRNRFWRDDLPEKIFKNHGSVRGLKDVPLEAQELFETAMEIDYKDHVLMQAELQKEVSNSISKTINMPREATVEDIAQAYILGWQSGLKGMTIFRDGSREGVLSVGGKQETVRTELKRGEIKVAPDLTDINRTIKLYTGCGTLYLTMTKDDEGNIDQTFVARGSTGTCLANQNAVSRLISLSLRGGISIDDVVDQLKSTIPCYSYTNKRAKGENVSRGSSCPTAIAHQLSEYAKVEQIESKTDKQEVTCETKVPKSSNDIRFEISAYENLTENELLSMGRCPKCTEVLTVQEGCLTCWCGYSKCA